MRRYAVERLFGIVRSFETLPIRRRLGILHSLPEIYDCLRQADDDRLKTIDMVGMKPQRLE